jgi:hypothetical protein
MFICLQGHQRRYSQIKLTISSPTQGCCCEKGRSMGPLGRSCNRDKEIWAIGRQLLPFHHSGASPWSYRLSEQLYSEI